MELQQYIKKENHLGTMRFDYADGETKIANRWNPYQDLSKEDIPEIQTYVNDVMFNRFNSFSKIVQECNGSGFTNEKVWYEETPNFIYAIKLIPVKGEYNGYIYVYRRPAEQIQKAV